MPSIHNTLLFKSPAHYNRANNKITQRGSSTVISEVSDNDYTTYSDEDDVDVDVSSGSAATRVDAFYLKSKNVTSHTATPTGGSGSGWSSRSVPSSVTDYEGNSVDTTVDDFQHDLYLLDTHFTATSVRLQFSGTDVEIYEVLLLELLQEIDANSSEFLALNARQADRTGRIDPSPSGHVSRVRGSGREKRDLDWTVKIVPGETLIDDVDDFLFSLEDNTHLVLAEGFSERPSLLYPAILSSTRIPIRYLDDWKGAGYAMDLEVREQ